MFEEYRAAGAGVVCVSDVDVMAAVVIICIANVVPSGCVGGPSLSDLRSNVGFYLAS